MPSTACNRATWPLLLGVTILVLAGCGGSSKTGGRSNTTSARTTTSTSTASASQDSSFVAQADAVCARINREIVALTVKSGSAAEVKRVVPRTISLERKAIAALEKLNPPVSLAPGWQRMLGYRRSLASMLGELLETAEKNDGTSIRPLAASKKRVHTSLAETAKTAGFKDCGKVGRVG